MRELDFLPERVRQQRARRGRLLRQGYLLAGCVVAMAGLTYVRQGRIASARGELAALDARGEALQQQVGMIPALERQMSELLIRKRIDEELGGRTDCTAVLAELARVMPRSVVLVSMELRTVEMDLEGARPGPRPGQEATLATGKKAPAPVKAVRRASLVLTGLAATDVDVANFIGQLSASCLFEDVHMGYAKTVTFRGRAAREFQASCYLAL